MDNSIVVDVTISLEAATLSREAFGYGLVVGPHTKFVPRTKWYEKATWATDMVADGFATTDPIYLAVQTYFAQDNSPSMVCVGRQQVNTQLITIDTATNSELYSLKVSLVDGVDVNCTYMADTGTSKTEIATGLAAAIESSSIGASVVASMTGASSDKVAVVTSGVAFRVAKNDNAAKMTIDAPTAVDGIDTDLTAIDTYDKGWYGLIFVDHSTLAQQLLAAAWVESNGKLYIAPSVDSNIIDQTYANDSTTIAKLAGSLSYARTAAIYHGLAASQYIDAAWFGACLGEDPGSINWAFKTLTGITADATLTPTQRTNARAKRCNLYELLAGVAVTYEGWCGKSAYFIDLTHGLDAMKAQIQEDLIEKLVTLKKLPFTNKGITAVQGSVFKSLDTYVDTGFIDTIDTLTVPKKADVSSANRAARILPDVNFTCTLAGALNHIEVNGVVTP